MKNIFFRVFLIGVVLVGLFGLQPGGTARADIVYTCYSYWGFEDYASNMTVLATNLFRNLASNPGCNYWQFMPVVNN